MNNHYKVVAVIVNNENGKENRDFYRWSKMVIKKVL